MKKLAIIRKEKESQWKSCQSITHNLFLSYESISAADVEIQYFSYAKGAGLFEAHMMTKKLYEAEVSHIIFIDHEPHPSDLINALSSRFKDSDIKPEIIFHLFGDFILQSLSWQSCSEALKDFSVSLVCASEKQRQLVNKLLIDDHYTEVIPFPLDLGTVKFDSSEREVAREELSLGDRFTFIYTGRLSYQKNVIDLIHAFAKLKEVVTSPIKLVLAGPMDDLGTPYLGKEGIAGTFFYHWEEALATYPELSKNEDITYMGNLEAEDLKKLYLAGDCYISMSAHNDEDYGMSPAEALARGLPCLLSSWGGFISFKKNFDQQVTLCPLIVGKRRHKCSVASIFKSMMIQLNTEVSESERMERSRKVGDTIGHTVIGKTIKESLLSKKKKKFTGFNNTFVKLASVFETSPSAPFRGADSGFSEFYRSLYEDYAKVDS
jgi:hypothetical protein